MISVTRYHDISCGHRVVGHEGRCRFLHGHNYRVHFTLRSKELDSVGRVLDFTVIKAGLCAWLEENWDHKFLVWEQDNMMARIVTVGAQHWFTEDAEIFRKSLVSVPFNPTAENMARYLVDVVGPLVLKEHNCVLTEVTVEETAKCSASYQKGVL